MNFYEKWRHARAGYQPEDSFIQAYLDYSAESIEPLLTGTREEVIDIVRFLLSVDVDDLINHISHPYSFEPKDVLQYSKLDDAVTSLSAILEYEQPCLTFYEAGKKLIHASERYACIKYGENHCKTASAFSLVSVKRESNHIGVGNIVTITPLGSIALLLDQDVKYELIRRLAIRNKFYKTLLYHAQHGETSYYDCVSPVLTGQTIIRRRHNSQILTELILGSNQLKERIRWI